MYKTIVMLHSTSMATCLKYAPVLGPHTCDFAWVSIPSVWRLENGGSQYEVGTNQGIRMHTWV